MLLSPTLLLLLPLDASAQSTNHQVLLFISWSAITVSTALIIQALLIGLLLVLNYRRRGAAEERKRFADLAESEHRHLDEVVSNVPGMVWEARLDPATNTLKPVFISDYVEKLLGYTPEEWLSQPGFGLSLIPEEAGPHKALFDPEAARVSGFGELCLTTKDERVVWVDSYLSPIVDDERKVVGVRGVTLDVSSRKEAEETLRQTEAKSSAILRAIPDLLFVQTLDGVYLDYHAKNPKDLLLPPQDFVGKNMREVLPPELHTKFIHCFERASENQGPQIVEYNITLDQTDRWFEARIVRTGDNILTVVREISDRKLNQEATRESETRFRNMADTAPVMIWVSGTDKVCTYFNQEWMNFTGRPMEPQPGNGCAEWVHRDDYARYLETYNAAFDQRRLFKMEYRLLRVDGVFRWVYDVGTPRFSASGKFLGYIGSCLDITDRKESEEALHTALAEVERLKNQLQEENVLLREEIKLEQNFGGEIVGHSDALKYVLFKIEQVAPTETTVLITGETGTGKELVARAIHNASQRKDRPLVKVNCAALAPTLIESEFFGHEKGAFTGAAARKIGRFEVANGGTIFLDEIGDLPKDLQVKLLRVIQEGELERLGSSKTIKVNVRIIAATNRNLDDDVKKGRFREDLWYRLNVFPITVPPLRQRREDITYLVEHFVSRFAKRMGKVITSVSPGTLQKLRDYSWPGNVRELANVLERAVVNSHSSVLRIGDDLGTGEVENLCSTARTLEEVERDYIVRTLEDTSWRIEGRNGAAAILGMNPSTLRTRMAKLGIQKPVHALSRSAS